MTTDRAVVLVMDDIPANRELLVALLDDLGHDQFGMFSAAFGSTSAPGSHTVRVTSGPASAATSFWIGGATIGSNDHVRPWGTIAR